MGKREYEIDVKKFTEEAFHKVGSYLYDVYVKDDAIGTGDVGRISNSNIIKEPVSLLLDATNSDYFACFVYSYEIFPKPERAFIVDIAHGNSIEEFIDDVFNFDKDDYCFATDDDIFIISRDAILRFSRNTDFNEYKIFNLDEEEFKSLRKKLVEYDLSK